MVAILFAAKGLSIDKTTRALYDGFPWNRNLREEAETTTIDIHTKIGVGLGQPIESDQLLPPMSPDLAVIQDKTCAADLVVLGTVRSEAGYFSRDGSSIFSVAEITSDEILRQSERSHITGKSILFASRSGGTVQVNGHAITMEEYGVDPLNIDHQYLFFLKAVPESKIYQAFSPSIFDAGWDSDSVFALYLHRELDSTIVAVKAGISAASHVCPSLPANYGALSY